MRTLTILAAIVCAMIAHTSVADQSYIRLKLPYGESERADTALWLEVIQATPINKTFADSLAGEHLDNGKQEVLLMQSRVVQAALSGSEPLVADLMGSFGAFESERARSYYPELLINSAASLDPSTAILLYACDVSDSVFLASIINSQTGYEGTGVYRREAAGGAYQKRFYTYDAVASCLNYAMSTHDVRSDLPADLKRVQYFDKSLGEQVHLHAKYVAEPDVSLLYPDVVDMVNIYANVRDDSTFMEMCRRMYGGGDWACEAGFEEYKQSNIYRHESVSLTGMLDLDSLYVVFYTRSGGVSDAFYLLKSPSGLVFVNQNTEYAHDALFKQALWRGGGDRE